MNFFRTADSFHSKTLWFLLFALTFTISCGSQTADSNANGNSNANAANSANKESTADFNDDIAALGNLVLLPFIPEEVRFVEEDTKNTNDKKLIAVLRFTPEDTKNLLAQAEKHRPAEAVEVGPEKWFPEELVAQSQLSGNALLKGTAYAPTDFIQLPYSSGRLIRVENSNYFVLELAAN
jgi:hypothetical protein